MNLFKIIFTLFLFGAVTLTAQSDYKWGNVVMGGGGFVSALITSKTEQNVIYARTDVGGAYRWNEANKSWVSITDWIGSGAMGLMGVDALALDPSNSNRVYLFAGTSYWNSGKTMILRSDDYGESFDTVNVTAQFKTNGNGMGRQNGERLAVDPNNPDILLVGTRNDGLWKSTNRGDTWAKVASAPTLANDLGINMVLFDGNKKSAAGTTRIFIGLSRESDNLYMSDDAGATWTAVAFPTLSKSLMPQRAVLTPGGKFLYVAAAAYAGPHGNGPSRGALLKYDTEAKTWTNISPENLVDDPSGDGGWGAYLGGVGGISIGGGADSNIIVASTINAWMPQLWENSNKVAHGDKIFASQDGGATWKTVLGGLTDEQAYNPTGNEKMALLSKNGFNWIEGESIHWTGSVEIDPFNAKRVFATSGNGIYMADDFTPGERFRFKFTVHGIEETVPLDLVSIPGGPLVTVIMDYDGFVHHDITQPVLGSRHDPRIGSTYSIAFAALQPNIVVRVGGDDKQESNADYRFPLYYSEDTAKTWKKFVTHPNPGQNFAGKIAVSADGKVVLWAPERGNSLLRTEDFGATWETASGVSPNQSYPKADPVDPDVFYAYVSGKVYISNDAGKSFTAGGSTANVSWTTDMQVTPGVKGHVWVVGVGWDKETLDNPVQGSLARSTDGGLTFHTVDPESDPGYTQRVQHAEAIGFGKEAPGKTYPAIYIYGTIDGKKGVWQSIDEAKSWVRVDDEKHAFGALANGNFVRGDMNTFGVVYRSTAGRGIAARMPADWSLKNKRPVVRPISLFADLSGNQLILASPNLTVSIYDLKGNRVFQKTYHAPVNLNSHELLKASGSYVVMVRNAAGRTLLNRKLVKYKN